MAGATITVRQTETTNAIRLLSEVSHTGRATPFRSPVAPQADMIPTNSRKIVDLKRGSRFGARDEAPLYT